MTTRAGRQRPRERALIVADGEVDRARLLASMRTQPRPWLIAADGGAGHVLAAGLVPDLVMGDLDSVADEDRARLDELGVEVRTAPSDKDESDMELCLTAAVAAGARHVSLLGATSVVRPEHGIANLLLLADPRLDDVDVELVGHGSTIRRIGTADGPGHLEVEGAAGDFVSLLPLGGTARGVSTSGLRYRLRDDDLPLGPSRGLSNELIGTHGSVTSRSGLLLVIHTDPSAEVS